MNYKRITMNFFVTTFIVMRSEFIDKKNSMSHRDCSGWPMIETAIWYQGTLAVVYS